MNLKSNLLIATLLTSALAANADVAGQWVNHPTLDIYSYLHYSRFANIAQATNNVQKLIDSDRYLYALIEAGHYVNPESTTDEFKTQAITYSQIPFILARYDKSDPNGQMEPFATRHKASGLNVTAIEYSQTEKCLAVGYDNGCFDLIYDDGRLLSNEDLKHFSQPGGTRYRSISFTPDGKQAVIASDFGILIVDLKTAAIEKLFNFKTGVNFANIFQGNIIASVDGVLHFFPADTHPAVLSETPTLKSSASLAPARLLSDGDIKSRFGLYPIDEKTILFLAPALAANVDGVSVNVLTLPDNPAEEECRIANLATTSINYPILGVRDDIVPSFRELSLISPTKTGWMIHNETDVYLLDVLGNPIDYTQANAEQNYKTSVFTTLRKDQTAGPDQQAGAPRYKACTTGNGKDFWWFVPRQGFSQKHVEGTTNAAKWTDLNDGKIIDLNACAAGLPRYLSYSDKYGLIARSDGRNSLFNNDSGQTDGLSSYKNGKWTVHTVSKTNYKGGWLYGTSSLLLSDGRGAFADPVFPDYVYMTSQERGIRRQNLADPNDIMLFTRDNYAPAFANRVTVSSRQLGSIYVNLTSFGDFDFDNDGTLWTSFCRFESTTHPRQGELWYWTAEDRGAVKDKNDYPGHEMKVIEIPGVAGPMIGSLHAAKLEKNKNLIAHISQNTYYDTYFYDHNGTLEDTSDDKWVVLCDLEDQNGDIIDLLHLPYGLIEDPYDGSFIIGTLNGIYVTSREDLFREGRPKVSLLLPYKADGSMVSNFGVGGSYGPVGMTLDGENRKWFVFENGKVVCISADRTKILAEFDSNNSPLPQTTYLSMAYNPETNSIFLGSYYGLTEFVLEGGSSPYIDAPTPSVTPRVVEVHYGGYINLSGLEDGISYFLLSPEGNEIALPKSSRGRIQLNPSDYGAGEYRLKDSPDIHFIINN